MASGSSHSTMSARVGRCLPGRLGFLVAFPLCLAQASPAAALPPLLAQGDETVVATSHILALPDGPLRYEARTGRIPIRHDETGEVRGRIFFTAYRAQPRDGAVRPITFIWNGGPSVSSLLLHTEMFGPRRLEGDSFVANAETLLTHSDLVFYDPVGTGFSRPERAELADEFYSTIGDFAATAEFIRAYRARFAADDQPLFLAGESYGTWRAAGVAEMLVEAGVPIAGLLLISGGIPGSGMSPAFSDAMFVPARTAAAFHHGRLAPELMRDRQAAIGQAAAWARNVYLPALERIDSLDAEERERIAGDLARFTGISGEAVDRSTLVVPNRTFLRTFLGESGDTLDTFDMRLVAGGETPSGRAEAVGRYLRRDLGYATDLSYIGIETGYMPRPGPDRSSIGSRWSYNHVEITPEMIARAQAGGGPPGSQPWLQRAMRADRTIRVFVAAGRYDSLNMCEGNLDMVARLEADLARRFTNICYEGGHMMYRDPAERERLATDARAFISQAAGEGGR
jgi:carboxypeptidase C (cathepsin A)